MIRTGLLGKPWASVADGFPISARAAMATTDANFPAADRPMPCAPWRILTDFKARRSASKPRRPQEKWGMAPLISRHNRLGARDDVGWRLVEPFDQCLYVDARHESELKVHLGALGDKLRVAHRLGKRLS